MLAVHVVVGEQHLGVLAVDGQRPLLGHGVAAVRGGDGEGEAVIRRRVGRVVHRDVEVRARGGADVVIDLDGGGRRRHRVALLHRRDDRSGALQEQPDLLHRRGLGPQLARFVDRRAVVVGGVDDRCGLPPPRGPAEGHVEVLDGEAVGDVRVVEHALVARALPLRHAVIRALTAPVVEPAAAELRREPRRLRRGAGAAGGPAGAPDPPVGSRGGRSGRGVGVARAAGIAVQGIESWTGDSARDAGARGHPDAVAALVVVEDRNGDAVAARRVVDVLHVVELACAGARQLVLDLIEDHRPGPVGELVVVQIASMW